MSGLPRATPLGGAAVVEAGALAGERRGGGGGSSWRTHRTRLALLAATLDGKTVAVQVTYGRESRAIKCIAKVHTAAANVNDGDGLFSHAVCGQLIEVPAEETCVERLSGVVIHFVRAVYTRAKSVRSALWYEARHFSNGSWVVLTTRSRLFPHTALSAQFRRQSQTVTATTTTTNPALRYSLGTVQLARSTFRPAGICGAEG